MNLGELMLHLGMIREVCEKTGQRTDQVHVSFVDHVSFIDDKKSVRIEMPLSNVQMINGKIYLYHPTSWQQLQLAIQLEKKLDIK